LATVFDVALVDSCIRRPANQNSYHQTLPRGLAMRKPTCHCAQPEDPGHGPNLRLTYKWHGKTVTQALPTPSAVRKAQQEIAEFRNYQQLSRELVEISEQVCRLRPIEEEPLSEPEKKRRKLSNRKSRAK